MTSRRLTVFIGTCATALSISTMTACSPTTEKDAPASTSAPTTATTGTSAPAVSPTEKALSPGDGNSFSPSVNPQPPGAVCNEIVNGVCVR